MAAPTTERFHEMVLDVEFVASSGTYASICGLIDVTVSRTANIDTAEVPGDCEDESLPLSLDKQVRSIEVTVSGTGVLARSAQSHLKEWFYSGQPKNIRLRDTFAATGDVEVESGPALITSLGTGRTKGQKVSLEIELAFVTTPARTDAT